MIFLLLSFLYQALAHYFDWRHLFRAKTNQTALLVVNYVIGCIGISLAYLGWLTVTTTTPPEWLLLASMDPRLMFIVTLIVNGLAVVLCYAVDGHILGRNRLAESGDEIAILRQAVADLQSQLDETRNAKE